MNLFIDINPSKALVRAILLLWLLVFSSIVVFTFSQFSLKAALVLFVVSIVVLFPLTVWQYRAFSRLNAGVRQLQFIDGDWYMVRQHGSNEQKIAIEIEDNNVLWPGWILLNYKLDNAFDGSLPKLSNLLINHKKRLLICRDAVSETDFRHLSRVLRFYRRGDTRINQE
ncbi:hypothetical protein CW740_03390 [Kangiella profundi]|uniref:Toxin CptA n=1 Tax=Kangiella profundi TaxID=1561924 RepID=A0A2K9AA84_9GAMM|nr:protein YgfX [Kangiella profundi]AUD78337.1 hypothetical protein CW740_03390 [Kangiella profundi]